MVTTYSLGSCLQTNAAAAEPETRGALRFQAPHHSLMSLPASLTQASRPPPAGCSNYNVAAGPLVFLEGNWVLSGVVPDTQYACSLHRKRPAETPEIKLRYTISCQASRTLPGPHSPESIFNGAHAIRASEPFCARHPCYNVRNAAAWRGSTCQGYSEP